MTLKLAYTTMLGDPQTKKLASMRTHDSKRDPSLSKQLTRTVRSELDKGMVNIFSETGELHFDRVSLQRSCRMSQKQARVWVHLVLGVQV